MEKSGDSSAPGFSLLPIAPFMVWEERWNAKDYSFLGDVKLWILRHITRERESARTRKRRIGYAPMP